MIVNRRNAMIHTLSHAGKLLAFLDAYELDGTMFATDEQLQEYMVKNGLEVKDE